MGQADYREKELLGDNHIFANIINMEVFRGRKVVDPEDLTDAKTDQRTLLADLNDYGKQLQDIHRKRKDEIRKLEKLKETGKLSKEQAERLRELKEPRFSILDEDQKLDAVVTIVIYFNFGPWPGVKNLIDLTDADQAVRKFLHYPPMHIIVPSEMTDEEILAFDRPFAEALMMLKHSENIRTVRAVFEKYPELFRHADHRVVRLFEEIRKQKLTEQRYNEINEELTKGEGNMVDIGQMFYDEGMQEGRQAGREEGREEGRNELMARLVLEHWKDGASVSDISKMLKIEKETVLEILRQNGIFPE